MRKQNTNTVVMVKPHKFRFNEETALTNIFQEIKTDNTNNLTTLALTEFEKMVNALKQNDINVIVLEFGDEDLPDAVFPNNWFATFENGEIAIFPMLSPKRRQERKTDILIKNLGGFRVDRVSDFTKYELDGNYLEGTGSVVFDRLTHSAYACESARTTRVIFDIFCSSVGINIYNRFFFRANDSTGNKIYHTNVMMSIGEDFCVICEECIHLADRNRIINSLSETGREIISISEKQLRKFCANILQLENNKGDKFIIMSNTARNSFKSEQIESLKKHGEIIIVNIDTIEKVGGGSVRCMLAEIFLPQY